MKKMEVEKKSDINIQTHTDPDTPDLIDIVNIDYPVNFEDHDFAEIAEASSNTLDEKNANNTEITSNRIDYSQNQTTNNEEAHSLNDGSTPPPYEDADSQDELPNEGLETISFQPEVFWFHAGEEPVYEKRSTSEERVKTPRVVKNLKIDINNPPEVNLTIDRPYTRGKKRLSSGMLPAAKHFALLTALLTLNGEPQSVAEARERDDWKEWKAAMTRESNSLDKMKTWTPVEKLPKGAKPISSKWIFRLKENDDGYRAYKARLVARGFT